jgi:hypothetical protein
LFYTVVNYNEISKWNMSDIIPGCRELKNFNILFFVLRVYDIASGKQLRSFKGTMGDDGIILRVTNYNHYKPLCLLQNLISYVSSTSWCTNRVPYWNTVYLGEVFDEIYRMLKLGVAGQIRILCGNQLFW